MHTSEIRELQARKFMDNVSVRALSPALGAIIGRHRQRVLYSYFGPEPSSWPLSLSSASVSHSHSLCVVASSFGFACFQQWNAKDSFDCSLAHLELRRLSSSRSPHSLCDPPSFHDMPLFRCFSVLRLFWTAKKTTFAGAVALVSPAPQPRLLPASISLVLYLWGGCILRSSFQSPGPFADSHTIALFVSLSTILISIKCGTFSHGPFFYYPTPSSLARCSWALPCFCVLAARWISSVSHL